jgi:hypothetical protein
MARLGLLALVAFVVAGCSGPNLVERLLSPRWGFFGTVIIVLDLVALVDLLGDDSRSTANKVLWTLMVVLMPLLGAILYFILKD